MSQANVIHDVRLTATQADIICWQEIQVPRYVDAILGLDDLEWAHYIGLDKGGAPISWRKEHYEFVSGGELVMYPGVAQISFTRKVVWVILKHLRTGELVAVVNAHFVAGAFKDGKLFPRIRRALWKRCRKVLLAKVVEFTNAGIATIVAGDFNRRNFRVLGRIIETTSGVNRFVQYPVPSNEIDQIMLISGKELVFSKWYYERKGGRYSDHQGQAVSTTIKKREKL
jgi:endonuclease/exonuclease/phosphatase family metal-dependent hydrolase